MKTLEVGNLNSMRDWGHAQEYAENAVVDVAE